MKTTMSLSPNRAPEVILLHNEIISHLEQSLKMAIKIGCILVEQKEALPHGEFGPWVKTNLPFTDRTARNYMRLYKIREELKRKSISDLKTAYRLLQQPTKGKKSSSDKPWDELTAQDFRDMIESVNDDLDDQEISMDADARRVFAMMPELDPLSDEDKKTARIIELGHTYCCVKNLVWHHGMASITTGWQKILIDDGLVPTEEPHKPCKTCCLFEEVGVVCTTNTHLPPISHT